jgi:hypothetical protein
MVALIDAVMVERQAVAGRQRGAVSHQADRLCE